MSPTVAEVLGLPEVQCGRPQVVAAESCLGRPVRWVHVLELDDVAGLLRGGEFVLSTGVALPETNRELREYVRALSGSGVTALAIELGLRWNVLPDALVEEAALRDLVLIVFRAPVPFVTITEAVHSMIVNVGYGELKASEQMRQVFTRLGIEGASVQEILDEAATWAGAPVVLENLAHRALAVAAAGRDRHSVLHEWQERSRRAHDTDATGLVGPEGWVVATVGARNRTWGRLVVQPVGAPVTHCRLVLDHAASALALGQLIEPARLSLEQQAHRSLLADVLAGRAEERDLHVRAAALGVPTYRRTLVGMALRWPDGDVPSAGDGADEELVEAALRRCGLQALVAPLDGMTGLLLALPRSADATAAVGRLAGALDRTVARSGRSVIVGTGAAVATTVHAGASLREAVTVARAARCSAAGKPYLTLADVRLDGLLTMLGEDPRLEAFVERELGPLLADPGPLGTELLRTLRVYLSSGRNHSQAASTLHLSRQALYRRIERLEQILQVDLDDPESCLSLHVALTALRRTSDEWRAYGT